MDAALDQYRQLRRDRPPAIVEAEFVVLLPDLGRLVHHMRSIECAFPPDHLAQWLSDQCLLIARGPQARGGRLVLARGWSPMSPSSPSARRISA